MSADGAEPRDRSQADEYERLLREGWRLEEALVDLLLGPRAIIVNISAEPAREKTP